MYNSILAPASLLVIWTLVIMFWMGGARLMVASSLRGDRPASPELHTQDSDPPSAQQVGWKSHNFAHLLEQPILFYVTVLILAVVGDVSTLTIGFAWGYVAFRIAHSLWQVTFNTVAIRFTLFILASLCLCALAVQALEASWRQ